MDKQKHTLQFISELVEGKEEKEVVGYIFEELDEQKIIEKLIEKRGNKK